MTKLWIVKRADIDEPYIVVMYQIKYIPTIIGFVAAFVSRIDAQDYAAFRNKQN